MRCRDAWGRDIARTLLGVVLGIAASASRAQQSVPASSAAAQERLRAALAAVAQPAPVGGDDAARRGRPTLRAHLATTPPVAIVRVEPQRPVAAELAGDGGKLAIECVIDEQGAVKDCIVLESWPALEPQALAALAAWRFTPALVGEEPRPVLKLWTWEHRPANAPSDWRPGWRFDPDRTAFRFEW